MARRSLVFQFADLPGPRIDRTKKHRRDEFMIVALTATVGGARSFEEIGESGEAYRDWFRNSLRLKRAKWRASPRYDRSDGLRRAWADFDAARAVTAR